MSDPKLISPMLDNFDMGGPISDHDGVRCCPAMRKNSDDKYIVKIISVPASQTKLDALLLTGAYPDKSSALAYFKDQADGIVDEKKILDKLARLEGFVPYEDCQIVPMEDATGYDVYLLSEYRTTLERQNHRAPMTQLGAVNLGLDLCAALAICRNSGYMYVDLKPSNIYITGDKEYRIGDIGFVRLNLLKYESLPDKYRSCYTAPEVADAFAALSDKLDIYAAGMILYQVFNEGVLPFQGATAPAEVFAPPSCADEEMAAIILKACAPDPADRWQDPVEMGQAIVSYMQKNGVNDTPLVLASIAEEPVAEETPVEEAPVEEVPAEEVPAAEESAAPVEEVPAENVADIAAMISAAVGGEEVSEEVEDSAEEAAETEEIAAEPEVQTEEVSTEEAIIPEIPETVAQNEEPVPASEEVSAEVSEAVEEVQEQETEKSETEPEKPASDDDEFANLSFLDDDGMAIDLDDVNYDSITEEMSEFFSQIDDLTAHEVPDPVVAPEPVEIKIPDPIVPETTEEETEQETESDAEPEESAEEAEEEAAEEEIPEEELPYIPKKKRTGLVWCIVIILLLALGVGGYFFYQEYYLQPIHTLILTGAEDSLKVELTADIDEAYLTVVCADSHGNKISAPVVGGTASFTGLTPDTAYTVSVEVDGFHQLTGTTTKVYSTPIQTKIAQMNVITGSEDGSVILSFAVEGPDSDQWNVIYNAEGEAERVTAFPSHMVTLTGLTVGKEYTFRLEPVNEIYLSGESETTYLVRNLICATNMEVVACSDGILTVQWDAPAEETVEEWSVRCYNDAGYDETMTTAENSVTFQNIDDTVDHTVEVIAKNMSVNQRLVVKANSVTVTDFAVDNTDPAVLKLSWSANREIPVDGWTLRYSINGVSAADVMNAKENAAQLPVVPGGKYEVSIIDGAGNSVLGGPFTYTQPAAAAFDAYSVKKADLTARLCKTPAESGWSYKDLKDEDYVNSFVTGEKISVVLASAVTPKKSDDSVAIGFVIYDENDNLISFSHTSQVWKSMWAESYCELDIPSVPADAGIYTVTVLFNGAEAGSQKFAITN